MTRRAIPAPILIVVGIVVLGTGVALFPRGVRPARKTPPPTDAEYRAFVRIAPAAFAPLIARRERTPGGSSSVPIAVGLADGVSARIHGPIRGAESEGYLGQYWGDGTYIAPRVPQGAIVDVATDRAPGDRRRELPVVVSGPLGTKGVSGEFGDRALLAEGASCKRDLGPLPRAGDAFVVRASGLKSDGYTVTQGQGPIPRRIALAPNELPPDIKGEPSGYAVLYDELTLWTRRYEGSGDISTLSVPRPFPLNLFARYATSVSGEERSYRVTGVAHVYRRRGDRWRYSRSWILNGHGKATLASDERAYETALKSQGLPPVAYGVPGSLTELTIEPLER